MKKPLNLHEKPNTSTDLVIIGRVGAVHGVKGAVKVHSFTEPKEQILDYHPWLIHHNHQWQALKVLSTHWHGQFLLVQFENFSDRDEVRLLTNADIAVSRSQLAPLAENEYYWRDLIGLTVYTPDGTLLGVVDSLLETGANDVLVVKNDKKEHLIPYLLGQFIQEINLEEKRIIADWDPEF